MKTKQVIFAVLICLMSAFAIIAAILGQSETQVIKIEDNSNMVIPSEISTTSEPENIPVSEEPITAPIENIVNSTTTEYATATATATTTE